MMLRVIRAALISLSAATLAGCIHPTKLYYAGAGESVVDRAVPGRIHYATTNVLFWGLVATERVNLSGYCQESEIRNIRTQRSILGVILTIPTLGIFSQNRTIIMCAPHLPGGGKESK